MARRVIEDVLPNALYIGIDYNLFRSLNPKTIRPFYEAHKLKIQYDDRLAWLNGRYCLQAFGVVLSKAFSKNSKVEYPDKPNGLVVDTEKEELDSKEEEIKKIASFFDILGSKLD